MISSPCFSCVFFLFCELNGVHFTWVFFFVVLPQQFRTLISYNNTDHTCFHVFYNKSKKVLYSVHYLHTVQNFMRHFVRQFFAFFQKCEPTSYGKLHICSTFLSPVKRGENRYGFRPVFSVFYFIISIPF